MKGERSVADLPGYGAAHSEGGRIYRLTEKGYLWLLAFAMRHRWAVAIVLVGTMLSLGVTMPLVKKNFLPTEDESRFEVTVRAPEGTSLAETQLISERLARAVREHPAIETSVLTVGAPAGDPSGRGANQSSIYYRMVPADRREISQEEMIELVRAEILPPITPEGTELLVSPIAAFGGSGQQAAPVQYIITGPDIGQLSEYAEEVLRRAREIPGVGDASTGLVTGRPAYRVQVDRRRAADLGVSIADISNALRLMVGGVEVTDYAEGGEQYDVRVRAPAEWRSRPEDIARITVPAGMGRSVRLSDVASIEESTGPAAIAHYARQRQATIFINTTPGASEQTIIDGLADIMDEVITDPAYSAESYGRSREMGRSIQSFLFAVLMSFTFMYLVLAAQFESWIHPITILSALPLTMPFAVFAVLLMGQSMNLYSTLGILVLFGVVKKNSILQVDHVRHLRRKGLDRADAIMAGNRDRLRPILMTTIAFVAGMIPLLISSGAGSGTNRAIGSVVAGGQTLSLLLTLIATPVIFSWLDDLAHATWVKRVGAVVSWPLRSIDRLLTKDSHEPTPAHPPVDADHAIASEE